MQKHAEDDWIYLNTETTSGNVCTGTSADCNCLQLKRFMATWNFRHMSCLLPKSPLLGLSKRHVFSKRRWKVRTSHITPHGFSNLIDSCLQSRVMVMIRFPVLPILRYESAHTKLDRLALWQHTLIDCRVRLLWKLPLFPCRLHTMNWFITRVRTTVWNLKHRPTTFSKNRQIFPISCMSSWCWRMEPNPRQSTWEIRKEKSMR